MSRKYYNLNEVLRWRAERDSNQPAFTFLKDGGEEEAQWSYAELDTAARAIAAKLQESVSIGQRILLLFPLSLDFVAAFWGCLYAGAIAVPAYPVRSQANVQRLKNTVQDCQPSAVLTTRRGLLRMKHAIDSDLAALQWIETDSLSRELADAWQEPQISRESIALLQYTSGSTGQPKGVVVNHGNLLHNEEIIQSTFGQSNRSVIVGWLPLYHDMGLMGTMLQPVYSGARCILMSPNAFLQRPFRWLEAISRYRATTSGGPNFAYELCVRKITEEERATLDLSTWAVAFNGAEPVRAETLEKFAARFAEVGFSRNSFRPCYGLAEATLLVSAHSSEQQPAHLTIDANKLGRNQVKPVPAGAGAIDVVSCGRTADGHEVAVVDPETFRRLAPNQIGEIWVAGPSVAKGYWNRPEETTRFFAARITDTGEEPFLRTGDLGFIENGSLFITGRSKDLIIIRGRNHYPQDIELTVQAAHPALKPEFGASFSVQGEEGECLVVLHEVEHGQEQQLSGVIDSICQAIAEQHEIQAHAVLLLRSGTIPRTSSGKIQRYLCRDLFLQEKLSPIVEWRAGTRAPIASSAQPVLKSAEGIQKWLTEKFAAWAGVAPENIQVHEPISRYGLDSLASIELSHAAERELGLSLPSSSLMQGKSIVELTRELMNDQPAFEELQAEPQVGNVIEEVTLSEGQKSLWYLHQLAPESTAYNLAFVARIVNGADTRVLRQIFQILGERHSSLRTTFHANNAGEPFQRIHPLHNASVVEVDASSWSDSVLKQHFQQEADTHFNLELGPLFRVTLFHRSHSECFIAITLHHIIGDLWSLAMLLHEMGRLYAAETKGESLTLPPLESSYSHFVLWQRKLLSGAEGARLNAYWTSQLEGELPVLELSTDRIRPTIQTYHGAAKTFGLGAELTQGLGNVSYDNNTTLYVTLLAAFQVLLHRHSGQGDILVGSPVANRTHASWANVFGYFVNPVVLRSQFQRNLPFAEFLAETHTTAVEALEHQHYPFSTLVEKLQPDRDSSRSPLFQAMFVFEKTRFLEEEGISAFALGGKDTRLEFDGLTFESVSPESRKALFDLTLRVAEAREETRCSLEYNTDLFDEETIRRMAEQWRQLLHGIVAAETTRVRDLPLLNDAERKQIVEEWNRTERDYPQRWVHELFEDQVKRTPEAVAVEYEDQHLKYEELNRRANQLAHYLRSMGVGPEVRVGICMERSVEMVVALLGVLKAGGAYVPLDPGYPVERVKYMLEDTEAAVLLTESDEGTSLGGYGGKIICLDREWERISSESAANGVCQVSGENLAYVIFTSGSTGRPKGVGIRHLSAVVLLQWGREEFSEEELSGVLAATSICFDLSVFEIFVPLSWGGKAIIAENALELGRMAGRERVKLVNTVPSVMKELVRRKGVPQTVLTVNLAGEALMGDLVREVYGLEGVRRVLNLYGPTEDTTYSTCVWIGEEEVEGREVGGVSIGKPVANREVYVLDEEQQAVPVGVAGELYIGGKGLARGYVNQAGLTAERFVPNAFARRGGERLYRTGDRVRWRSDGNLEYLGRLDQQVKIRGYRIELGEIEAVLQEQAGVAQAVVVAREDVPGEKRLVAYVVGGVKEEGISQVELDGSELRRQLRGRLPEYMVPSAYVQMKEMPLNANGKLDRKRLPQPQAVEGGAQERKSRTVEEEILCGIWEQVLRVERVGVEENFFEIGGHSLLATQVISRIREAFGVEIPLRILFERPTVAGLAEAVRQARMQEGGRTVPLLRVENRLELPLSYAQQRLWFLDQMEPGNAVYNVPVALRLRGELDRGALSRSIRRIVERHEVLRTVIVSNRELEPVQLVLNVEEAGVVVQVMELGELGAEQREAEARRLAGEEAGEGFNLSTGPLLRVKLLGMGEQEHVLLVTMHHIVSDGWSVAILVKEFSELYAAFSQGQNAQLPELEIQYADYALWQRKWLEGPVLEEQLQYWREELDGAAVLELPTDYPRTAIASHRGGRLHFDLNAELVEKIKRFSQKQEVTSFMTLLAAFQILLARYSGQKDIVVGTDVANRNRLEIEPLVGFFVNELVLRTQLEDEMTVGELLKQVRRIALGAYAHQDLPFEKLVEELAPIRDMTRSPFFPAKLVLQNTTQYQLRIGDLAVEAFGCGTAGVKIDLEMVLEEHEHEIHAEIHYAVDLFDQGHMQRLAGHYQRLLETMTGNVSQQIWDLPLMSENERRQVLVDWNETAARCPERNIHELFEEQAARTPEATAVEHDGTSITYCELNEKANQIAHWLRKNGVLPEVRVGISMKRSADLVVALLGVLKSGGSYVPLDPAHPEDRRRFMMEDAKVAVLVNDVSFAGQRHNEITSLARTNPQVINMAENLAYVLYTSGSTGKPKGVGIEHRSLMNYIWWARNVYELETGDVDFPLYSSISFDLTVTSIFTPLIAGGCIHIYESGKSKDNLVERVISEGKCGSVKLTPSHLSMLGPILKSKPKQLILGGEALQTEMARRVVEQAKSPLMIWNEYGPTEATVACALYKYELPSDQRTNVPIGKPGANAQIYILDKRFEPVVIGVTGEIYIGGAGLARGYVNRPDLTAERFVPNPFSRTEGERLYCSGDRARYLADGNIEYLGRTDKQVKIRGYRVELGEIESVLNQHPGVRQGAVVVREDEPEQRQLVAYVAPRWKNGQSAHKDSSHYRLPNGMRVAQQNRNETEYLYRQIFENQVYFQHGIELPEDACVVDIGANIGMFTLFAGQRCPNGRIYAFEPITGIFDCLKNNVGLVNKGHIRVFQLGMADTEKKAEFTYYSRYSMMSGLSCYSDTGEELETVRQALRNQREAGDSTAVELLANIEELLAGRFEVYKESCQLRRLSQVVREEGIERIDLLKIDAQRAELDVLLGIDDEDWAKIQQIVMEVHDAPGQTTEGRLQQLLELLEKKGFYAVGEQYGELRGTNRWNLYASRKKEEDRNQGVAPVAINSAENDESQIEINSSGLRKYLMEKLPDYMVPSAFVLLDELPRNANGKLDYKALPRPDDREGLNSMEGPWTPVEEILVGIWCEVLKVNHIGAEDNFFTLGGHSLLATQVISRAEAAFGVELSLHMVFDAPTIRGFASHVEQVMQGNRILQLPPIAPVSRELPLPLSFAQQRLWFLQQFDKGNAIYNLPYALRLQGLLDEAALEYALTEIVRRHEVLRTHYELVNGQAVQRISPPAIVPVESIDLRGMAQPAEEAKKLVETEIAKPFDLTIGPIFRVHLLQLADDDHVILLAVHHIASDGWSVSLLVRECAALYRAAVMAEESGLQELPVQYADFAAWQRQVLNDEALKSLSEWWSNRLHDLPVLNLPLDRPRPAVNSYEGAVASVLLPEPLVNSFETLCRKQGITTFMGLLAVFQVLVGRYAGQADVVIGTEIAGRNRLEIESLIGFFINQLALRLDYTDNPQFVEMLARVREMTLNAYAHQDMPFERLVDVLGVERNLSLAPVFQSKFVLQNMPQAELQFPELRVTPFVVPRRYSQVDLTMSVERDAGTLRVGLEYATDLFYQATAEGMLQHFRVLVESLIEDPCRRISEISLLSASQRQELLEAGTGPQTSESFESFSTMLEAQVECTPNAIAIADHTKQLTFQELNEKANQLAHYLIKRGARCETIVGLCMDRSADVVVAALGILKSGAAWLPLNPAYPPGRLSFMLKDAQAAFVVTQEKARAVGAFYGVESVCLDTDWNKIAAGSKSNPQTLVLPEQLAYVIHTSGSTGRPKGVMLQHCGMINHLLAKVEDLEITGADVVAQNAVLSFDVSLWQLLAALIVGGKVCVIEDTVALDGSKLLEECEKRGVTVLESVPSLLAAIIERQESFGEAYLKLEKLRVLVSNAEALLTEVALRWKRLYPELEVRNTYGATECSDDVTHCNIKTLPETLPVYTPLGKPLRNCQIYVLDVEGEPVPAGVPGEMYIGGMGVGRGYLNEPAMTASKFVPDHLSGSGGGRLYRTGDRGQWLTNGSLQYLERMDQQVKVHGYRVEMGEIEAVLNEHAAVKQSAVVLRQGEGGEKQLVGYVVGAKEGEGPGTGESRSAEEELRSWVRKKLPEYMVPSAVVRVKELPLTPNGKLDRKTLAELEVIGKEGGKGYEEPQSGTERILAGIWGQVLQVERVGRRDNFFRMGGDSILSIKVVTRAGQAGVELTVQQMFQYQTLAELAAAAGVGGGRGGDGEEEVQGKVPLTAIQEWFFEQEMEGREQFNQALMLEVKKPLGGRKIGEAVKAVLQHHDAVRLRFERRGDGEWEQWYAAKAEGGARGENEVGEIYEELDLCGLTEAEQTQRMAVVAEAVQKRMNLRAGPVARAVYFELGEGRRGRLLLVMHHLIVDGVSWRIVVEDVHTAMQQLEAAGEVVLLGKSLSWQKWSERVREWVKEGELEGEEAGYWLKLEQKAVERLPRDYEGGGNLVGSSETVERELGEEETLMLLRKGPERLQAEMQEMLVTGLVGALLEWGGGEGVLVEMEGHGRESVVEGDVSRTVGWFTTHYPVWLEWRRGAGLKERLGRVKERLRGVPRHGMGYGLLRYVSENQGLRKRLASMPQAEVIFNYVGQMDETLPADAWLGLAKEGVGETQDRRQPRGHVFAVWAEVSGRKLKVGWRYGRELHHRATVEKLADAFMESLHALVALCSGDGKSKIQSHAALSKRDVRNLLSTVSVHRASRGKK